MKLDENKVKQQLTEMFTLQDKFNTDLLGEDWREQRKSWYRHIAGEVVEAQEHLGSKWWKSVNRTPEEVKQGEEQAFIELVDVMHFIMSYIMSQPCYETYTFTEMIDGVVKSMGDAPDEYFDSINVDILYILDDVIYERYDPWTCLDYVVVVCYRLGYTFDDLYQIYIGKNALNHFRQANGYKEGKYFKIWAGEEDNVWLARAIKSCSKYPEVDLFTDVTKFLQRAYDGFTEQGEVSN